MSNLEVSENLVDIKERLKNKQRIRLIFPYSENAEVKKLGAKWDKEAKFWYYPSIDGSLPEELCKYKAYRVDIEYDDKEFLKPILTSMKFDKEVKSWFVNQADYEKFVQLSI